MMNCQPYFSGGVEDTAEVTPRNSKAWASFYCFQVTSLHVHSNENWKERKRNKLVWGMGFKAIADMRVRSQRLYQRQQ